MELLFTNGTRICYLPNLPSDRYNPSQTNLTSCRDTSCATFTGGSWVESHTLAQGRAGHSAWASPQGVMLLGGSDSGAQGTSEILLENGDTSPGFNYPKLYYVTRYV